LAGADAVADIDAHEWPDPSWWQPADYAAARERWPDHALVYVPGWMPLFWGACEAFGMQEALIKMLAAPEVFGAYVRRHHAFYMDLLGRGLAAARGHCDICWLGDDFASQQSMIVAPDTWRRHIKPYLAEQVRLAREHGLYVLYHSCGAVRPVLPDLIEIGVNGLLVFQTRARGMDAPSIARDFGGQLVFYGGIDVQQLLSFGTPQEVEAAVQANVLAFAECGGYVVANSHHRVATIRGENVVAMCRAAGALIGEDEWVQR
jgi:uroporphyrinogen decarboxylase